MNFVLLPLIFTRFQFLIFVSSPKQASRIIPYEPGSGEDSVRIYGMQISPKTGNLFVAVSVDVLTYMIYRFPREARYTTFNPVGAFAFQGVMACDTYGNFSIHSFFSLSNLLVF